MTALQALREINSAAASNTGSNSCGFAPDLVLTRYANAPVETDSAWYPSIKRGFDIVASLMLLIALSPLMLIVAIAIRLESKGPVFFSHTRCGLHGKHFDFFKFRSMVVDAEAKKSDLSKKSDQKSLRFKMAQDPRITRVGSFIRKYSLDELPQLLNVLKGDMSLVGPRPPIPSEVAQYNLYHHRRLAVTPGITCTWQIGGRSDIEFEQQVDLDITCIRTRSFWQDLMILIKTPLAVITARGAY
jgi:exopolysaccharide biosynthesis polyprenyl glycosylphosphotransferase